MLYTFYSFERGERLQRGWSLISVCLLCSVFGGIILHYESDEIMKQEDPFYSLQTNCSLTYRGRH